MADPGENLWAWFVEGEDSFMAELIPGPMGEAWYPLVFSTERLAKRFEAMARKIALQRGRKAVCRQYRFEKICEGTK